MQEYLHVSYFQAAGRTLACVDVRCATRKRGCRPFLSLARAVARKLVRPSAWADSHGDWKDFVAFQRKAESVIKGHSAAQPLRPHLPLKRACTFQSPSILPKRLEGHLQTTALPR